MVLNENNGSTDEKVIEEFNREFNQIDKLINIIDEYKDKYRSI